MIAGCRTDWERVYTDGHAKFVDARLSGNRRELNEAAKIAAKGCTKVAVCDRACTYKFCVLKAEIEVSKDPKTALQIMSTGPPPELANSEFAVRRTIVQALAYGFQRDLPRAKSLLDLARQQATPHWPEQLVTVSLDLAYLEGMNGDDEAASRHYQEAIRLARRTGLSVNEANAHINYGSLLMHEERYDEAIEQFQLALAPARSANFKPSEQMALGNMGWSHFELGNFEAAKALLSEAAEIAAALHDPADHERWVRDLGVQAYDIRDFPEARRYYLTSLALAQSLGDKDAIFINYNNLAQLEMKQGNLDKAEEYNNLARATDQSSNGTQASPYLLLTTAEIALARKQFQVAEDLLRRLETAPDADNSLRWQAESDLAGINVAQGKFADANVAFENAMRLVEDASEKVIQEERRMSILDAWPFYDDYIRFLIGQSKLEKALQVAEFSRTRTLAEAFGIKGPKRADGLTIAKIQAYLKPRKQTVLAYWLSDQESYLWTIAPTQFKLVRLPPRAEIERQVESNARQLEQQSGLEESTAARRLYDMLVQPAKSILRDDSRVIVVPHRSLYKLNFETLLATAPQPHYWIEDVEIENAGSLALLVESHHHAVKPAKEMLLIGAPTQASEEFKLLKHAPEEVSKVEAVFPADKESVITGKDAVPAAYAASQPAKYRYLHFVTHGTANQVSPLDSAIVLSPGEHGPKLYAREIKAMPINADLVTISACDSAGKKTYAGEGLVGLAWAFMRAGAHQVMAALWEVDDASTPDLMDNFYREMKKGRSAAAALRLAKLKMLRAKGAVHLPYYWGSLQLYTGP